MNDTRLEASSNANFYQSHRGPLKDIAVIGGVESVQLESLPEKEPEV